MVIKNHKNEEKISLFLLRFKEMRINLNYTLIIEEYCIKFPKKRKQIKL